MSHHIQLRFVVALAALAAAIMSIVAPSHAAAQNCNCEFYTIAVDAAVACKVTVCVVDPSGVKNCITVSPGTKARINCVPGGTLGFRDCHGVFVPFNPSPDCHLGIGAGPSCCTIDACLDNSVDCPVIKIRPSILDVCPCL